MKQLLQWPWQRVRRLWRGPRADYFSEIDLLQRRLTVGDNSDRVMVDVGAQFGESFAPFQQKGWQILAFEPDPDPRKQKALSVLAGDDVTIARCAIGEYACESADFFASEVSTGISALVPFHASHRAVGKVTVSTLAIELGKAQLNRVDFLKVDTEGHDLFVLKGFPWAQTNLRPYAVLCEYEDAKTRPLGYLWQDLADYLVIQGYSVLVSEWKPIVRYGVRHDWVGLRRYPGARINPEGWGNLIALSTSADVDWFMSTASKYLHA